MLLNSTTAPPNGQGRPQCVNLRERFGKKFRVRYEESYYAERPEFRAAEEAWLQIIPCDHGHIGPWGGNELVACTNTAGATAKRLRELPFARVQQDGADGTNVVFAAEHFDEVAEIMRPKRRRVVSGKERKRLAALSREHSPFRKKPISQGDSEAQFSTIGTLADSQDLPEALVGVS